MNRHSLSKVKLFNLIDNGNASYVQFGDHKNFNAKFRGIAVKQTRFKTSTDAGEPQFDQFEIFKRTYKRDQLLHFPKVPIHVEKPLYLCELPNIEAEKIVRKINIVISSNSSSIIIGNGKRHYAESRQKNIRQHL